MTSNILIAIKNLVKNPVIALTAHYSGRVVGRVEQLSFNTTFTLV